MDYLFLYASVPETSQSGASKLARSIIAIKQLALDDELNDTSLLDDLFDKAIWDSRHLFDIADDSSHHVTAASLRRALRIDGYDIIEGKLVPTDGLELDLTSETSVLEQKLMAHMMPDVISTLEQAHQSYIDGRFEACNAMLRTSLEGTLKHIAAAISGNPAFEGSAGEVRKYLEDEGFFDKNEIEFVRKFFGYSSANGSHPGLSSESESRLRRLMTVALLQYSLEKFESQNA